MRLHLLIAWIGFLQVGRIETLTEHYCGTVVVQNKPSDYKRHTNDSRIQACTVVEGDVRLSLITNETNTADSFESLRFTNLREITGSLLIYQIGRITSLDVIFPELRVIRGHSIVSHYALILYQNPDLIEIGLSKLTHIGRGGVRIAENPNLCHANTLNWTLICPDCVASIPPVISENQDPNVCSENCDSSNTEGCATRNAPNAVAACWNYETCQFGCPEECYTDHRYCNYTVKKEQNNGSICCHKECLGGCVGPTAFDCFACRGVIYNNQCMAKCPPGFYMFNKRRCITREQCKNRKVFYGRGYTARPYMAINHTGTCDYKCPENYQETKVGNTTECVLCYPNKCKKTCGQIDIHSLDAAQSFKSCNIVEGSLVIMIQTGLGANVAKKLEESLGSIEEVRDFVRISFTPSLVSLSILKHLKIIRGKKLWSNKYAFTIFENSNLAQIWNNSEIGENLKILNGKVAFHLNPQLCPKIISEFVDSLDLREPISENDISSNGNKAICEEAVIDLKLVARTSESVVIKWSGFDAEMMDHRMFLGYQIFYRMVQSKSVNIFENRDACSDNWAMRFVDMSERGTILTHLLADTLYAVYIKTLVKTSTQQVHHNRTRGAISSVLFVRTSFDHPTQAIFGRLDSPDPHSIYIDWKPPESPNGQVTHYVVSYMMKPDTLPKERNYCDEPPNYAHVDERLPHAAGHFSTDLDRNVWAAGGGRTPTTTTASTGHCAAQRCCDCSANGAASVPEEDEALQEKASFENTIQNTVFLSGGDHSSRGKRSITGRLSYRRYSPPVFDDPWNSDVHRAIVDVEHHTDDDVKGHSVEPQPSMALDEFVYGDDDDGRNSSDTFIRSSNTSNAVVNDKTLISTDVNVPFDSWAPLSGSVNVTDLFVTLRGLRHFTLYEIKVSACQNTSVRSNFCSRPDLLKTMRTSLKESADIIDANSLVVVNATRDSPTEIRLIKWAEPKWPNGRIVAYEIEYLRQALDATSDNAQPPKKVCLLEAAYKNSSGVSLADLLPGNYTVTVRVVSLAQRGPWSKKIHFFIPQRHTTSLTTVLWTSLVSAFVFILVGVALGVWVYKNYFKKHMDEYVMKVVSANPDYLSSLEVYKQDEWELKRESIQVGTQIGRGCFGIVYKGYGIDGNIESVCGVHFGDCAIKTVFEKASFIDRFQFLLEASVMKDLKSAYIVKLLGVVSEGHPAWVVMEYMENGSLKEYLMDRRPDDSNTKGLSPPTCQQMHLMAAQIADGMAYLEARKFLHRDLAARNCMVTASGTCKIGDFGFARDVYCKEYYKLKEKRLMPARWMPPESLKDGTFSSHSDVWSYGILLWEIAAYGGQPYPGMSNQEVLDYVVDQRSTLNAPKNCPPFLADLMQSTWAYDPQKRPSFDRLVSLLAPFGDTNFKQISYYHTQKGTDLKPVHKKLNDVVTSLPSSSCNPDGSGSNPRDPDRALLVQPSNANVEGVDKKLLFEDPVCNNNRRASFWTWVLRLLPFHKSTLNPNDKRHVLSNGFVSTTNGSTFC